LLFKVGWQQRLFGETRQYIMSSYRTAKYYYSFENAVPMNLHYVK
jgi:hypothetical protein